MHAVLYSKLRITEIRIACKRNLVFLSNGEMAIQPTHKKLYKLIDILTRTSTRLFEGKKANYLTTEKDLATPKAPTTAFDCQQNTL